MAVERIRMQLIVIDDVLVVYFDSAEAAPYRVHAARGSHMDDLT